MLLPPLANMHYEEQVDNPIFISVLIGIDDSHILIVPIEE
jgi:hypothetical protein